MCRRAEDCYADQEQWDHIHEMLKDAFLAVPAVSHRRLWALRMLALSHQGKNVTVAMGKMKVQCRTTGADVAGTCDYMLLHAMHAIHLYYSCYWLFIPKFAESGKIGISSSELDAGFHGFAGLATNFMWHCMGESFVATSLK